MKPSQRQIAAYHAALDHLDSLHAHSIDPITKFYKKQAIAAASKRIQSIHLNEIFPTRKHYLIINISLSYAFFI